MKSVHNSAAINTGNKKLEIEIYIMYTRTKDAFASPENISFIFSRVIRLEDKKKMSPMIQSTIIFEVTEVTVIHSLCYIKAPSLGANVYLLI